MPQQQVQPEQVLSGQRLRRDRGSTAQQIVWNIGEWRHRTNVVDYRDYDVRRTNIDPKTRGSLEDLIEDEPERLLDYVKNTPTYKQNKIKDFETFKKAFREAFSIGGKSGNKLWDAIEGQEDLLLKLFAETGIQQEITDATRNERVRKIARKYKIPTRKARELYEQIRVHEIQLVQEGVLPVDRRKQFRIRTAISPTRPRRRVITQRSRGSGTEYERTKPRKYTTPEERFLMNNPNVPVKKLTAQFNILFGAPYRTRQSIYYKRYRLLQQQEEDN